jgi:hypothetical protein
MILSRLAEIVPWRAGLSLKEDDERTIGEQSGEENNTLVCLLENQVTKCHLLDCPLKTDKDERVRPREKYFQEDSVEQPVTIYRSEL